ncbi:Abi family protein [Mycolicibacterium grossiae]|uniref:Abi family protein n=1 Tax=Mycolicibacterium grossiae TaxID=1552759 RepID=UPI001FEC84C5|nr:Abi family protein [Mycolicibacterium grossiae]
MRANQRTFLENTVRSEIETVRHIRNRVAHHEPIFARNLPGELQSMQRLVQWRSAEAAAWFNDMEKVTDLLNARP